MVSNHGQMEQNMKGNGRIIKQMAKESFGMLMGIFMMVILINNPKNNHNKDNERMTKQMAMVYTTIKMGQNTKATEKMICRMDSE